MKTASTFLLYELRRSLRVAIAGWLLLLILPIIHRLATSSWNYWNSDWAEPGAAVAVFIVSPVVAFYLASLSWAVERQQGTLRWLYARPLPAMGIFLIRLLAILVVVTVWTGGALLMNGSSPAALAGWAEQPFLLSLSAWMVGVGLGMGGGCLATVLFSNRDAIILCSIVGAVVLLFLVPWATLEIAPTTTALMTGGRNYLATSFLTYGALLSVALLAGAGYAVHRTPADSSRLRRAMVVAGTLVTVTAAVLLIMIIQPRRVSSERSSVRSLGSGNLYFAEAPGLENWLQHPVLVDINGVERRFRDAFVMPGLVMAHAGRGRAVGRMVGPVWYKRLTGNPWLVIDSTGDVVHMELHTERNMEPVGWSPDGAAFAWIESYRRGSDKPPVSRLALMNYALQVSWIVIETPTPYFTATWIDDRHLLLAMDQFSSGPGWWMVIDAAGVTAAGPGYLSEGEALSSVSFAYPLEFLLQLNEEYPTFSPGPLARRDGNPVLILRNCAERTGRLVMLDTTAGELKPLPSTTYSIPLACNSPYGFVANGLVSVGSLEDGSLVWAEPVSEGEARIVAIDAGTSRPRQACLFDEPVGGYRGGAGSWAVWADPYERHLLACQVETGEVREKKYLTQFLGFCHLVFPLLQHSNTPVLQVPIFDKERLTAVYHPGMMSIKEQR